MSKLDRRWRWPGRLRRPESPALDGTVAVVRLLPRVDAGRTALLGVLVLAGAALPVATAVELGLLVGSVPAAAGSGPRLGGGARHPRPVRPGLPAHAARAGARSAQGATLTATFARRIDLHLQERVLAAVGGPPGVAHLEDPQILDLIKNAQGVGTEGIRPGSAVTALATLVPSWLRALGSAAVLIAFLPWLGLAWIAVWPLVLAVLMREFVRVGRAAGYSANTVRRAQYFVDLALAPGAAKEVRLWGMLDWLVERFQEAWLEAMRPVWRMRRPGRPAVWLSAGAVGGENLLAYALLTYAAVRGDLALGALAVYASAVQGASGFRAFDDPNAHLAYAAVAVPSLLELEQRLAAPAPPRRPGTGGARPGHPAAGHPLRRGDLRLSRSGARADRARPGDPSRPLAGHRRHQRGRQDPTLIKLLCGLYAPGGGRITVDGQDLAAPAPALAAPCRRHLPGLRAVPPQRAGERRARRSGVRRGRPAVARRPTGRAPPG